ncbi:hypothetical protein ACFX2C_047358 [Malus domestica]
MVLVWAVADTDHRRGSRPERRMPFLPSLHSKSNGWTEKGMGILVIPCWGVWVDGIGGVDEDFRFVAKGKGPFRFSLSRSGSG